MNPDTKIKVTYWTSTFLFLGPMTAGAIAYTASLPPVVRGMTHLGYPLYLIRFLGVAKLLGVMAILVVKLPVIKQWAYAGFAFNLLGAAYSHLCSGDGPKTLVPLAFLCFGLVSYRCSPARVWDAPNQCGTT